MRRYFYPKNSFNESDEIREDCWVKVVNPTTEDIDFLVDELGVPDSFIADIADSDERPRVDDEEGWIFTIIRIPVETPDSSLPYSTVPIGIIYHREKRLLVTICYHRTDLITDFIRHSRRKKVCVEHYLDFILRLILSSAVWYLKYLKQISFLIMEAEEALESSIKNEDLLQLMSLQKCLVYFSTSIRGNEAIVSKINATGGARNFDPELAEDTLIELRQAYNTVSIHSEILTGTMDAFASVINNNVNTIMKRMTSISIILMLPTFIASLYGMNLINGLEKSPWAFWVVLFVSIAISYIVFLILKRIKWF